LKIAGAGYLVLGVVGLAFLALRRLPVEFTNTQRLILSAALAAPLLLALLWEHVKGFKVGEVEITLNEVAPTLDVELASAIQGLQGSATPTLVETVSKAAERSELKLVEVNLRSKPYWWSTRLFLLAALADEYTRIDRFIFVEGDAARQYLGMASPSGVRRALARWFPDYDRVYRDVLLSARMDSQGDIEELEKIGYQWPGFRFHRPTAAGEPLPFHEEPTEAEKDVRELITRTNLLEWIGAEMETDSREWTGEPASRSLYARILTCNGAYVPLLSRGRLEMVVNRNQLALRLASACYP
jgi:hypothetical protein